MQALLLLPQIKQNCDFMFVDGSTVDDIKQLKIWKRYGDDDEHRPGLAQVWKDMSEGIPSYTDGIDFSLQHVVQLKELSPVVVEFNQCLEALEQCDAATVLQNCASVKEVFDSSRWFRRLR